MTDKFLTIEEHPDYIKNIQASQKERKELLDNAAKAGHGKNWCFVIKE